MKVFKLTIVSFLLVATNIYAQPDLSKLHWLLGNWEYKTKNIIITENWKIKSDTSLVGVSYTLRNLDTVSSENISIIKKNSKIIYNAQVKEQNGGVVIPFIMNSFSKDSIVFENNLHDFPQRIIYTKISNDKIMASIEGIIEGKIKRRNFYYYKKL